MPFIRTAPVCNPNSLVREQINAITSYLDASLVYGNEEALARALRNQSNSLGLMAFNQNFTDVTGLGLLPFENVTNSLCLVTNKSANIPCFIAGMPGPLWVKCSDQLILSLPTLQGCCVENSRNHSQSRGLKEIEL